MKEFKYLINERVRKQIYKLMPPDQQLKYLDEYPKIIRGNSIAICINKGWFWNSRYDSYEKDDKYFFEALEKYLLKKKELPEDYVWQFGEKKGQSLNTPTSSNEPDFKEWVQNKINNDYLGVIPDHFAKAYRTGNPMDLGSISNLNQWNDYLKEIKGEETSPDQSQSDLEYGFVYFIRNQDIYKIGITQNLLARLDQLKPNEVLNIVRCSNYEELEKILHKSFKAARIPQSEYFRLTPDQVKKVHQLMTTKANFQE